MLPAEVQRTDRVVQNLGYTSLNKRWPSIKYDCLGIRQRAKTFRSAYENKETEKNVEKATEKLQNRTKSSVTAGFCTTKR